MTSGRPFPFEQNAADDAQEMGERENLADGLRPLRHAAEGKHEAGEQDRRQKDEEGHLHRLKLVLGDGGEGDAHGEIGGDEDERDEREAAECCRASARERENARRPG